ncbi:MAG: MipA/OmpV family protein [Methylotenera sp.]|nr:MipA/OmpV family protein [Methylotenera sp.]
MKTIYASIFITLAIPLTLHAEQRVDTKEVQQSNSSWDLGVGVAIRNNLYAGERTRVQPFPFISHEWGNFYIKGPYAGYRFINDEQFSLNGYIAARPDGIDKNDFGTKELAKHRINRNLLEDRKNGADAGLSASWKGELGEIELDFRSDITNVSNGYQTSIDYNYPVQIGEITLISNIGVTAQSKKLANYYFGTLSKEVSRGVIDYKPGNSTIPHIGLTAVIPFASRWTMIAGTKLNALPSEISKSPLVDDNKDCVSSVFVAITKSF